MSSLSRDVWFKLFPILHQSCVNTVEMSYVHCIALHCARQFCSMAYSAMLLASILLEANANTTVKNYHQYNATNWPVLQLWTVHGMLTKRIFLHILCTLFWCPAFTLRQNICVWFSWLSRCIQKFSIQTQFSILTQFGNSASADLTASLALMFFLSGRWSTDGS